MLCAIDTFIVSTSDIVTTTFTRKFTDAASGLAFQPAFVMLFCSGRAAGTSGLNRGNAQHSRGIALSPTKRSFISAVGTDAVGTSYAVRNVGIDACVNLMATSGGVASSGKLDCDAVLVDGMRFVVDEVFEQDVSIGVIALGGDLSNVDFVHHIPADDACATDPVDVTGFGFDPAMGIALVHGGDGTAPDTDSRIGMGAFRTTTEEGAWASGSQDGAATSDTARYQRYVDAAMSRVSPSGNVSYVNDFNALITDGFRFNCIDDNDVDSYIYGLLGGSFSVLEFDTRATIGTITLAPGFEVAGGIIMSCNAAESIDNTHDAEPKHSGMCIGAFNGIRASQQLCYYVFDEDALATTQVTVGNRFGSVYMRGDEAASPVLDGSIEIQTINATQVILNQSVADPVAAHCIAILFGTRDKARQRLDSMSGYHGLPQHTRYA